LKTKRKKKKKKRDSREAYYQKVLGKEAQHWNEGSALFNHKLHKQIDLWRMGEEDIFNDGFKSLSGIRKVLKVNTF
jgi:hypothetical protein